MPSFCFIPVSSCCANSNKKRRERHRTAVEACPTALARDVQDVTFVISQVLFIDLPDCPSRNVRYVWEPCITGSLKGAEDPTPSRNTAAAGEGKRRKTSLAQGSANEQPLDSYTLPAGTGTPGRGCLPHTHNEARHSRGNPGTGHRPSI